MSDYEDVGEDVSASSEDLGYELDDFEVDEPGTPAPQQNSAPAEEPAKPGAPADDTEVIARMVKVENGMSDVTIQHFSKYLSRFKSFSSESVDVAASEFDFLAAELKTVWGGSQAATSIASLLLGHPNSTGQLRMSVGRCFKGWKESLLAIL